MKCHVDLEQGAINSIQRVRKDFKRKVIWTLKGAGNIWPYRGRMAGEKLLHRTAEAKARQTDIQTLVCSQLQFQHPGSVSRRKE